MNRLSRLVRNSVRPYHLYPKPMCQARKFSNTIPTAISDSINSAVDLSATKFTEFIAEGSAWNPVNLTAQLIEALHITSGTSWPTTIFLFAFGLRTALFPFTALQTRSSITANNLRPELERLRSESLLYRQQGQVENAKAKMVDLSKLTKDNQIGIGRLLGFGLLPVPFFMSAFFALRAMTSQNLPSMLEDGVFWFNNLCAADPYYILPIITTGSLLLSLEASRFLNPNLNNPTMTMFMRGMYLISLPVTAAMPSAVVLYFIFSNLLTALIQLCWRVPLIRQFFKIPMPRIHNSIQKSGGFMETFLNAYKSGLSERQNLKEHDKNVRRALRKFFQGLLMFHRQFAYESSAASDILACRLGERSLDHICRHLISEKRLYRTIFKQMQLSLYCRKVLIMKELIAPCDEILPDLKELCKDFTEEIFASFPDSPYRIWLTMQSNCRISTCLEQDESFDKAIAFSANFHFNVPSEEEIKFSIRNNESAFWEINMEKILNHFAQQIDPKILLLILKSGFYSSTLEQILNHDHIAEAVCREFSSCFLEEHEFPSIGRFLTILQRHSPSKILPVLEGYIPFSDDIWSYICHWIAYNGSIDFLSDRTLSRINSLPIVPTEFLLRCSSEHGKILKASVGKNEYNLSFLPNVFCMPLVLASLCITFMSSHKIAKLSRIQVMIQYFLRHDEVSKVLDPFSFEFSKVLTSLSFEKVSSFHLFINCDQTFTEFFVYFINSLIFDHEPCLDPQEAFVLLSPFILLNLNITFFPRDRLKQKNILHAESLNYLLDFLFLKLNCCSILFEQLFVDEDPNFTRIFVVLVKTNPKLVENTFLNLLYDASKRLSYCSKMSVFPDLYMKAIIYYEHFFPEIASRFFRQCSDILKILLTRNLVFQKTLVERLIKSLTKGIKLPDPVELQLLILSALLVNPKNLDEDFCVPRILKHLDYLDSDIVCEFFVLFNRKFSFTSSISILLSRLIDKCGNVAILKKLMTIKIDRSLEYISSNETVTQRCPKIEYLLCYSRTAQIKFCILQLKQLLRLHSEAKLIEYRTCLAYTIQEISKFLKLTAQPVNNDVWKAFETTERDEILQFIDCKYRFDSSEELTDNFPFSINSESSLSWRKNIFLYILTLFMKDPETFALIKMFAAVLMCAEYPHADDLLTGFIITSILRHEVSHSVFIMEFCAASELGSDEICTLLLVIYEKLNIFNCMCRQALIDLSRDEFTILVKFWESIPKVPLARLAVKYSCHSEALKLLEEAYTSSVDEVQKQDIVRMTQSLYFSRRDYCNVSGLSFLLKVNDLNQLAYYHDSQNDPLTALQCRLTHLQNGAKSILEINEMINSLIFGKLEQELMDIFSMKILKQAEFIGVLERSEISASLALSNWEISEPEYEGNDNAPCFADENLLHLIHSSDYMRSLGAFSKIALIEDLISINCFDEDEILNAWNAEILNSSTEISEEQIRLRFKYINLHAQDSPVSRELQDLLCISQIQNYQTSGNYFKAQIMFYSLSETAREENVLLQANLFFENHQILKAIELLELEASRVDDYKIHLHLADYKYSSGHFNDKEILKHFEAASRSSTHSSIYYKFAKYLDKDFGLLSARVEDSVLKRSYLALKNYSRALMSSDSYDVEILPRYLTIWLDIAAGKGSLWIEKVNIVAAKASKAITAAQFFKALAQLVSRLLHQNKQALEILQCIFLKVFIFLPHGTLWSIMAVLKSSLIGRQKRAVDLFLRLRKDPTYGHLCKDYSNFSDLVISLANYRVSDGVKFISVSKDLPALRKALPATIQIPSALHQIDKIILMESVLDRIEIILSMQKPKKVAFRGYDGGIYYFLCKPNDDLRKDYRMIGLFDLFNHLVLSKNSKFRSFCLIPRFSVTALNDEAGLIEWVANTQSFRSIILNFYKKEGVHISFKDIKLAVKDERDLVTHFVDEILPKFPIVFHRWLIEKFPISEDWFNARMSFTASAASISMLGYIVGLGDRHGENILIDYSCGRCVHVDFNCLFDKGKTFEVPEVVPFRLTRNMTSGMGLAAWRGTFLEVSIPTLELFRRERDLLHTNMESFVYDPMVEWVKQRKNDSEFINEQGFSVLQNVLKKIKGLKEDSQPSSTRCQALELIGEAIDISNLAKMYIGWSAFI